MSDGSAMVSNELITSRVSASVGG